MSVGSMEQALLAGAAGTFLLSVLVVLTQRWHGRFTLDSSVGVQKMHTLPTPRIGGGPLFIGILLAWGFAPQDVQALLTPVLVAGLPAFFFGLAEDVTNRVGVLVRLLATMASGLLVCWLTGYSLTRVDVWGLDVLLQWLPLSLLFTAFAIGGIANSINIIDGFNGLASSVVMIALLALGVLAYRLGDGALAGVCFLLFSGVTGFFWVNWPYGKLFLGDGGSYFLGFALAWVAVLLVQRHDDVTAFTALLVCLHPFTEVLFSVYRRRVRHQHPGMPDRLHLHSLVNRRVVKHWLPRASQTCRNSVTGVLVGALTLVPAFWAQWVYVSVPSAVAVIVVLVLAYITLYARMVRFHWCSPISFLFVKPAAS